MVAVLEKGNAVLANDLRAVRQPEFLLGNRFDSEPFQDPFRYDRVNRSGVYEKLHLLPHVRIRGVPYLDLKDGQTHCHSSRSHSVPVAKSLAAPPSPDP